MVAKQHQVNHYEIYIFFFLIKPNACVWYWENREKLAKTIGFLVKLEKKKNRLHKLRLDSRRVQQMRIVKTEETHEDEKKEYKFLFYS